MTRTFPRRLASRLPALCATALVATACSLATVRSTETGPLTDEQIAQLWVEPDAARDLFWGPGGREGVPRPEHHYRITALDETGYSSGYEVVGPDRREWKIKLGSEAQSEIVASRLLWAIGFHQPAMHALETWRLEGSSRPRTGIARFRLKEGYRTTGTWSWRDNPFVGTREFKGLLVAQLLLNNWDLKTSNNRVYTLPRSDAGPRSWFVVQDLGAALGETRWPTGTRNNVAQFERQRFIKTVGANGIEFDYHGRRRGLFRDLEPSDVVWACRRLARLSDRQWRDAFLAARYPEAIAARFIAKLRSKIQEGLMLVPQSGND